MDRMMKVAKLDADFVYWGPEDRAASLVKKGDLVFLEGPLEEDPVDGVVYLDGVPDNKPGRYRWEPRAQTFVPLMRHEIKAGPEAPTLEKVFFEFLTTGPEAPHVVAWREWYRRSMDERKG